MNISIELDGPISYNITIGVFIFVKSAIFHTKSGENAKMDMDLERYTSIQKYLEIKIKRNRRRNKTIY